MKTKSTFTTFILTAVAASVCTTGAQDAIGIGPVDPNPNPPAASGTTGDQVGGPREIPIKPEEAQAGEASGETPAPTATVIQVVAGSQDFTTFSGALKASGLDEVLSGEGPFTVFAPSNQAFRGLPEGELERLMKSENREELANLLRFHVVARNVTSEELKPGTYATLEGATVEVVGGEEGEVTIQGAKFLRTDIKVSNGTIHVIDKVIMPVPEQPAEGEGAAAE